MVLLTSVNMWLGSCVHVTMEAEKLPPTPTFTNAGYWNIDIKKVEIWGKFYTNSSLWEPRLPLPTYDRWYDGAGYVSWTAYRGWLIRSG